MSCLNTEPITIVKGDSTDFGGQHLLTIFLTSDKLDLDDLKANFTLLGTQRNFYDLSSGQMVIDYSSSETATFPLGTIYGDLKLISKSGKTATIENRLAFNVISVVHGNAIATKPYEYTINVEQGGETILNIDVKTNLIQIQVGTVETLPAGSPAYVRNTGDANDAVFEFGIPEGDGIKRIEKTSTSGLVDTYTITSETGKTTTFEVTNGSSIQSIEKTGTDVLVDTYTVTLTNGNTTTFEVTNGRAISSIAKTGTSGLVDTYTITYNDNTTSTFNITNGKDATINGVNALTLNTAYGISISQSGDTATISGKGITDVVDGISALIPSQASEQNQLADKGFVNSTVQTATANFRGNWEDWASVPTNAEDYPLDYAQSRTPTVNDYLVVQDSSDYTGETLTGTWRFKYSGEWSINGKNGWHPEYQVNETPLTAAQLAALNSGATTTNIAQITTNKNAIGTLANLTTTEKSSLVGAINELDNDKQENITGGASTITSSNLTANRALISNAQGKVAVSPVTNTELGYLSGTTSAVQTQLNSKASTSLDNLSATGQMIIDSQNGTISNCILEIPHDIKLELNNGTVILKAGSKVVRPNGDIIQTTADYSRLSTYSGTRKVMLFAIGGSINIMAVDQCFSGSTQPTVTTNYAYWLDTSTTPITIKLTSDMGTTWSISSGQSFPLCILTQDSTGFTSIDQVFNGFGYIGGVNYCLPNVKILIPNGINTDGTLKSIEYTNNAVRIGGKSALYTLDTIGNFVPAYFGNYIEQEEQPSFTNGIWYKPSNNTMYRIVNSVVAVYSCVLVLSQTSSGDQITSMTTRQPVRLATTEMLDKVQDQVDTNATAIATKQDTLVSGTNIKTINSTPVLGSGNFTLADQSLGNLNSTGQMIVDSQNGTISNCILDIPHDINLTLENGTLTLKSGSILTAGDGTQYQTAQDTTWSNFSSLSDGIYVVFVASSGNFGAPKLRSNISSGSSLPETASNDELFFNTTDLKLYRHSTGSWAVWNVMLPLGIINYSNGVATLEQVFNGAGYIGHHAFVLPDVTWLSPQGLNSDETFKSVKQKLTSLKIKELTTGSEEGRCVTADGDDRWVGYREVDTYNDFLTQYPSAPGNTRFYCRNVNKIYVYAVGVGIIEQGRVPLAFYAYNGTSITKFDVRQPVRTATVEMVNNYLSSITGYDATATQTLKNVNGVFTWVTDV